jgi:hypothetical protein
VSEIPSTIADIGSVALAPRQNPTFEAVRYSALTSDDYFVFSRIDGRTTLREIILQTGFDVPRTVGILRKLRRCGAFLMPDENAPPNPPEPAGSYRGRPIKRPPPSAPEPAARVIAPPTELTPAEGRALAEDVALTEKERLEVIALLRLVERGHYFDLLGVGEDADARELKRAYHRLSKQFHPDRYYGKTTGSFGPWLSRIFEVASKALELLSDDRRRLVYLAALHGRPAPDARRAPTQTPEEHAQELFDRACGHEARGELAEALAVFAAAIRQHAAPKLLRRAAHCAMSAGELKQAKEYAKKAAELRPDDASCARLLASVFRAAGELREAEDTLVRALAMTTLSNRLIHELESDLAEIRGLTAGRRGPGD